MPANPFAMLIRPLLRASFLALFLSHSARADLTITQKVEGLGQDAESTALFKDGKTRVDAAPGTSLILDLKTGETISLSHPQKKFLKIPADLNRAAIESVKGMQAEHPDAPSALTATGKRETISGYPAEEYACTVAGVKMALWLTKDLPDYQAALREMGAGFKTGPLAAVVQNYGVDFAALPGFPVRTVLEVAPGQILTRTVTVLSLKPLPASDFEIPAGYTEIATKTLTPPGAARGLSTPEPTSTGLPAPLATP